MQRALTRVTFDDGLQIGATWSPDGRFLAYSSDRGGKFDIWVQQVSGGDPVQVTKGPGQNWQPDWSPDGKYIAYRSEDGEGGLFVVPALGGEGLERKIASFGYLPAVVAGRLADLVPYAFCWRRLERTDFILLDLDGSPPREILADFVSQGKARGVFSRVAPRWEKNHSFGCRTWSRSQTFGQYRLQGALAVKSEIAPEFRTDLEEYRRPGNRDGIDTNVLLGTFGKAIYFGRSFQGAQNLWKMTVDPETLRATAIERLTTGSGPDTELESPPMGGDSPLPRRRGMSGRGSFPLMRLVAESAGAARP